VTEPPRPYAAVDIDGVLADVRHRLHHIEGRPKNWDAFFAAAVDDPPMAEGRAVAARLAADHDIIYLTGRPERYRSETTRWLEQFDFPPGQLVMRRRGDRRPARVTKVALLRQLSEQRRVDVLVDDDDAVCDAAEAAGYAVLRATWMPKEPVQKQAMTEAQEREGRT
jgi:hypothetical protein